MQITVQVPDEVARALGEASDLPRHLLEALAADGYRRCQLSRHQVSRLLGLDYWETESFLGLHQAKRCYTRADLEVDRRSLAGFAEK